MTKKSLTLSVIFIIMLLLAACSSTNKEQANEAEDSNDKPVETEDNKVDTSLLPMKVVNEGEAIEGGTLHVGLVADSPFKGVFLAELYVDATDSSIMSYASNGLFNVDGDFLITDEGIAKLDVDTDNKKVTITIQGDVNWSDGTPLMAEDLIYPYEIIGHPDYDGVRYDDDFKNIIGAEEYHDGKADTISGIKKIDDKSIEISLKKISPAIFSGGDGLWGYAAPKHQLESIAIKDLISSDAVRKNPITLGAFKYDQIVNGESVQFVANEHYYKGKPKVDKLIIKVVSTSTVGEALKAGQFDIASFPATQYDSVKDLTNISILGRPELSYGYLGFKLGHYDQEKGENVYDEKAKMNDVDLRKAIAYAMDIETVTDRFYQGLRVRANSLIPPAFKTYYDDTLEGYHYNPEKAKQLLDAAGYKDIDGDGIREDKEGNKFTIRLAAMSGSDTAEAIIEYYRQNWKDVGLDVQLTTGRLIEFNNFYDKVQADDPEIDIFIAAWSTGTNPSPAGLYSKGAAFNFSRYVSDDLTKLLNDIDSQEALDATYRAQAFRKWQEYMADKAMVVPMLFSTSTIAINNRIKSYNIDRETGTEIQDLELIADEPIK
ncbi:oligopeptide ABC transporter substrate-binding protein [Lysinibacillus mangiferihumi]|uniref:Oligopeptide ABC transporter substrate-binding protein n=1 Tax=Lysinibacillus mangiferihumi TaxID=1130819 RepID=A0A4U2Z0X2_9BACI|nr:oligopeptide ABC transporter substrate-binding protein [Lysinibacillus mangiferihumi]TKI67215.1 oligopeptide ABC transporter substrate-binding protein [Lysinibacillus mangiferihumi]